MPRRSYRDVLDDRGIPRTPVVQRSEQEKQRQRLREQTIHSLRMQGWSRIDAENEADERLARLSAKEQQG